MPFGQLVEKENADPLFLPCDKSRVDAVLPSSPPWSALHCWELAPYGILTKQILVRGSGTSLAEANTKGIIAQIGMFVKDSSSLEVLCEPSATQGAPLLQSTLAQRRMCLRRR